MVVFIPYKWNAWLRLYYLRWTSFIAAADIYTRENVYSFLENAKYFGFNKVYVKLLAFPVNDYYFNTFGV